MLDTLLLILLSLGLNFGWTDTGQIKMDSSSKAKLEQSSEFQKAFGDNQLTDIIITDNDDPSKLSTNSAQK